MQNIIKDLQDLHNRLVANYNDNVPFEQLEEDRLVVSNTLDLINQYEEEQNNKVKEFAERLTEKYQITENSAFSINPYAFHTFIDNLLKEMGVE